MILALVFTGEQSKGEDIGMLTFTQKATLLESYCAFFGWCICVLCAK